MNLTFLVTTNDAIIYTVSITALAGRGGASFTLFKYS